MSAVEFILVLVIVWWLIFFMTLPFGVRRDANPPAGTDRGAPVAPLLVRKILATTIISLLISLVIRWVINSGLITLGRI